MKGDQQNKWHCKLKLNGKSKCCYCPFPREVNKTFIRKARKFKTGENNTNIDGYVVGTLIIGGWYIGINEDMCDGVIVRDPHENN